MTILKEYFYLLKIHHWVKNLTIFLPIIAAHKYSGLDLSELFFHFLNLSFLSSIIYLFNNVKDYESDKQNKILKYQIIVNKKELYYTACFVLFFIQLTYLILINSSVWIVCILYFTISILYNLKFKKIKYVDILTIATFHILRVIYGSEAFNIELSIYFILFCSLIFLMIGTNKRLIETKLGYKNRPYHLDQMLYLQIFQYLFASLSAIIYLLYITSPDSIYLFKDLKIKILNFFIVLGMILNFLFNKNMEQDIVLFFYKNKLNYILSIFFLLTFLLNSNFF